MIKFEKIDNKLILSYSPQGGTTWIQEKFESNDDVRIKKVFYFLSDDVYQNDSDLSFDPEWEIKFVIGTLQNDEYYHVSARVLNTQWEILIHKDTNIVPSYFGTNIQINVLKQFEDIANAQIIIGGLKENAIPVEVYEYLIKT